MRKYLLFSLCISILLHASSQDMLLTDSIKKDIANAKTVEEKINNLADLARFYMGLNRKLSDEYGREVINIAEQSRDRKMMARALLLEAERFYTFPGFQENVNKALELSQKALDLSKSNQLEEYIAWSYLYLARGSRINGNTDKALNFNNLALSISNELSNDSLRISCYNDLGGTYLAKNEKLLAFRNYLNATNLAEEYNNFNLLIKSYERLSEFYTGLDEIEKAKDLRYKTLQLTYERNRPYERLEVYYYLGRLYMRNKQFDEAQSFYEKAIALSDSLKFPIFKLNIYGSIVDLYFFSNQMQKAIDYFQSHKELREYMVNAGFDYFLDMAYGNLYTAIGNYDSAKYYYNKAGPVLEQKADLGGRYVFYTNYSNYLRKTGNYIGSIEQLLKAKNIAEKTGSLDWQILAVKNLDSLYQKTGDHTRAYFYKDKYHAYKDSLQNLGKEKDLMLLEVDNENKRKERLTKQAEEQKRNRHNIQYMGITVAIAGVFVLLVMAGTFSVSKTTIRILGFFAFIFLFEFIILLADNQIHHFTHGEPWKVLAIKIILIAILLPLHHWLEEKVIHYLTTHKLLVIKGKSLRKWSKKKDTDVPVGNL
ncbi:MAG: tetratricopeptide repeat protein [Chitinophagaceae bacterium]|nr:tetratricopeptide repeat protein [Chitinophagaceae bacterium]